MKFDSLEFIWTIPLLQFLRSQHIFDCIRTRLTNTKRSKHRVFIYLAALCELYIYTIQFLHFVLNLPSHASLLVRFSVAWISRRTHWYRNVIGMVVSTFVNDRTHGGHVDSAYCVWASDYLKWFDCFVSEPFLFRRVQRLQPKFREQQLRQNINIHLIK